MYCKKNWSPHFFGLLQYYVSFFQDSVYVRPKGVDNVYNLGLILFRDSVSFFVDIIPHTQCSSQKILLEGQSGPYNPFLGARYFKKGPMYQYLSNMEKRRNSWKVKEMKMAVYLKLTWGIPFYTQ